MTKKWRVSGDLLAIFFLIIFPLFYFWQVTLLQGLWYSGDTITLYLPFGIELSRALEAGRLPLWAPAIQSGFPLFAESQVGALYPVNLVLFRLLPAHFALAYSVLLHLIWAGCGMFMCARQFGVRPAGALIAALAFSFNGFMLAHIIRPAIVATASWLPWLIFLQDRFQRTRAQVWFLLTVLAFGVHFLIGSVQIAFLNTIALALFSFFGGIVWHRREMSSRAILRTSLQIVLLMILGIGIAAIQLVPTAELIPYSVRGGSLPEFFNVDYSLPFSFLSQFVLPFAPAEPSVSSSEYWGYVGLEVVVLAGIALWVRRDHQTIFLAVIALGALSLTLGDLNPIYTLGSRLPVFNFFRVPARYLLIFVFAVALLSALAFNELTSRLVAAGKFSRGTMGWGIIWGLLSLLAFSLANTQSLQFWLNAWQVIPLGLGVIIIGTIAMVRQRRIIYETFAVIMIGLTIFDRISYAPAIINGISTIMPVSYVLVPPRSLSGLDIERVPYRVITDQSVFPSLPAIRNSLFPNLAMQYGKESVNTFSPLAFGLHWVFQTNLSPAMLNVLNARYFMVPLEPRGETKTTTPERDLALDVLNREATISPLVVKSIRVLSFTEQAEHLEDGTLIGTVVVRQHNGQSEEFPVRLGIETADWDYDRKKPRHKRAAVAHSFPAFWRAFGRTFSGHIYLAQYDFASPREIVGISVRALVPEARLTIEAIVLEDANGKSVSLAHLTGKNEFSLAYMSDTVAVWENLDVLPRAFLVPCARIINDSGDLARMHAPDFDPRREVILADAPFVEPPLDCTPTGTADIINYQPERVEIRAMTDKPAYLVLTDSWYPGWHASVNGQPAPIYRANMIFRAVPIESGTHDIVFEYRPLSFVLGALISAVSLLIVFGISLGHLRLGKRQ